MKNIFFCVLLFLMLLFGCNEQSIGDNIKVAGVAQPVILLNGTWKFTMTPPENFWENKVDFQKWDDIKVPGECQMQGFPIKHDVPYVYKREIAIPKDYNGKQILLYFYGVYSYAKVWVNGHFLREHFGGFTKWSCDITNSVVPGEIAVLTVEIVDRTDDISYGSGYAKHQIGGILRDVELVALPEQNFKQLNFETDLDENYKNAKLKVFYALNQDIPSKIRIELLDMVGKQVTMIEQGTKVREGNIMIPVENPKKWDAEHPNLYSVRTTLFVNGKEELRTIDKIGFREVKVSGNKLLVNGKQVKLRGACRHSMHPLLGRMTTAEYDKKDVLLAKEANINFIRTSHYPPSEAFLNYCDQYGIYVEDETAVCFVNSYRAEAYKSTGASQDDPAYTGRYLSQLEEMVQNYRNHPCIIIWSLGNESVFGDNFVKSFQWVKKNDVSRPVIFSYPGLVPDSLRIYDIVSMHYPSWKGDLSQYSISVRKFEYDNMPVLFDEWAHVPCYNINELRRDPNVRNFWGQSLDSMWTNAFEAEGALGGAIWGMIDETFMLPEDLPGFNQWWGILDPHISPPAYAGPCVGYGEWGIVDIWRRKKPEFWETKKAYSPTRIMVKEVDEFVAGHPLKLPVYNRFDHTDFNEIKIRWEYHGKSGEIKDFDLAPHQKGELIIPANSWKKNQTLNIKFFQNDTFLIDEYNIRIGKREALLPTSQNGDLSTNDQDGVLHVSGQNFSMEIDKRDGLLKSVMLNNHFVIKSGPYLYLSLLNDSVINEVFGKGFEKEWKCTDCRYEMKGGMVKINTEGVYRDIKFGFTILIGGNGVFDINYSINGLPEGKRIEEFGIKFVMGSTFEKIIWDSDSYFSAYPANHLGVPAGETKLNYHPKMKYMAYPDHDWSFDTKEFYYFGLDTILPLTRIARSLKENIYSYSLKTPTGEGLTVNSKGEKACRFNKVGNDYILYINDLWDYPSLGWGNYTKGLLIKESYQNNALFSLNSNLLND